MIIESLVLFSFSCTPDQMWPFDVLDTFLGDMRQLLRQRNLNDVTGIEDKRKYVIFAQAADVYLRDLMEVMGDINASQIDPRINVDIVNLLKN